jgi:hypothetical protein
MHAGIDLGILINAYRTRKRTYHLARCFLLLNACRCGSGRTENSTWWIIDNIQELAVYENMSLGDLDFIPSVRDASDGWEEGICSKFYSNFSFVSS